MIQYPEVKSVVVVLISEEGAGKGLLLRFLKGMLGGKKVFESSKPKRDVWGDFNVHMKDAWRGVGSLTPFIGFSNIIS